MALPARQVPDYHRLCAFAKRVRAMDARAVLACATVHAVGAELASALQESLARYGITEGRLRAMAILLEQDRPLTHSELADLSGVTKGTVTGLVDGLARDGYVERQPDPDDRRVVKVALTAAGQACVARILPDHLSRLSRMMANLTEAEQQALIELLHKVHAGLPALTDPAPSAGRG